MDGLQLEWPPDCWAGHRGLLYHFQFMLKTAQCLRILRSFSGSCLYKHALICRRLFLTGLHHGLLWRVLILAPCREAVYSRTACSREKTLLSDGGERFDGVSKTTASRQQLTLSCSTYLVRKRCHGVKGWLVLVPVQLATCKHVHRWCFTLLYLV